MCTQCNYLSLLSLLQSKTYTQGKLSTLALSSPLLAFVVCPCKSFVFVVGWSLLMSDTSVSKDA